MKNILVVGSLNMDMVYQVDHHPRTGETILGQDIRYFPGGKGANQAYGAARLGGDVTMLGVVGQDEAGQQLVDNLQRAGVKTSEILSHASAHTGTAFIAVNKEGNNTIVVIPGANAQCDVAYLTAHERLIEKADIVLLQMEIPMETLRFVVETAKSRGKTVILNPAPAQKLDEALLSMIDYLTPNETELEILSGKFCQTQEEIVEAARDLLERGVQHVVVTLGAQGAAHIHAQGIDFVPGRPVTAVDTTAAGDCFNGALAVALAEGKTIVDAIRFGNLAASLSVTRAGAQSSMPSRVELMNLDTPGQN